MSRAAVAVNPTKLDEDEAFRTSVPPPRAAWKTAQALPGRLTVAALEQPRYSEWVSRSLGCAVLGFGTAEVTRM